MATPTVKLLGTLEDLGGEDFEKFKWLLQQQGELEGFPAIRKSRLENANRIKTMDQMMESYSIYTVKVMKIILGKMNHNDLVEKLSKTIPEPEGKSLKREVTK